MAVWSPTPGTERKKVFKTKDAAKAHLQAVAADHALGRGGAVGRDVDFADYATLWLEKQVHQRKASRAAIESRLRLHIIPAFADIGLRQIRREDVQAAVAQWSVKLAPSTVKLTYTYLSGILSEAVLDGLLVSSPCVKIKLPAGEGERVRPLPVAAVQAVADAMSGYYRAAVVLAASTGLRPGEWRSLTWDRVDLAGGWITVDRQLVSETAHTYEFGPLKTTSSYRKVKIGPELIDTLQQLEPGPFGLVIYSRGAVTRGKARTVWARVRRDLLNAEDEASRVDIGSGWHQLRHFHASQLIAGGASPVAVAHRLGHKDATETLQTYAHLWPDDHAKLAAMSDGLVKLNRHETATPAVDASAGAGIF
ncbi:tyrosine-type recombinase/integrase [Zhihengliuella flava]|uniref:Integrase n=1 Tax=Zhihengliuella flava TaxID=1285193 RepID=A0A931GG18_9MICC|nr:site-specific integrase [Zhihengliuella flava]MBG6085865.1 integrase [Zhihengliuella flava]